MNRQARLVKIEGTDIGCGPKRAREWNSFGATGYIEAGRQLLRTFIEPRITAGDKSAVYHVEVRDEVDPLTPPAVFKFQTELLVNCINPRRGC